MFAAETVLVSVSLNWSAPSESFVIVGASTAEAGWAVRPVVRSAAVAASEASSLDLSPMHTFRAVGVEHDK
ncbi:hypothetical protein GCM10010236_19570 [Streptomyces eurythermus]|nr:hypothetical protein GCM10010236_19570 [Streptomyces eurythermus]